MTRIGKVLIPTVVSFFVLTFITATAYSVTPQHMQTINYQGMLENSGGVPVNGTVNMTFLIYNVAGDGSALWTETQSGVSVNNGAFSVVLGNVNPITLPFDEQYYLGVQVETDTEMSPRTLLLSVPYAIRAAGVEAPLELSEATTESVISVTNTGTGIGGTFQIDNAVSTAPALYAYTNGTGRSGFFAGGAGVFVAGGLDVNGTISGDGSGLYGIVYNHDHDSDYVDVSGDTMNGRLSVYGPAGTDAVQSYVTAGNGSAGYFEISSAGSGKALSATTNGSGNAISASNTGMGGVGKFHILNTDNGSTALLGVTNGFGYAGYFSGGMGVFVEGQLLATGLKNFVQPHPTNPRKQIAYVAVEAPESAVMIRGKARLVEGRAVIETPEYFRLVAGRDEEITVQFTPRALNTLGLAAVEVTKEKIVVGELMNGTGSFEFDYLITAKRAGFEGHEPIQPNTIFTANMKTADEFEKAYAKGDMTTTAMRKLLVSNGILTADGKLNMELASELGWAVKDSDFAMK